MKMSELVVSFDEWFKTISSFKTNKEMWELDDDKFHCIPPKTVAQYLKKLLTEASVLCAEVPPTQVAHMIWFFNGICSSYWRDVRNKDVPQGEQVATVCALGNFYRDFLDPYLTLHSSHSEIEETEGAVYMLWDMDCLEVAAMFPGEEYLVDPIFKVLSIALRCKTTACQKSALHGLGHLENYHPKRVRAEIDWALKTQGHLQKSLFAYARQARKGGVL